VGVADVAVLLSAATPAVRTTPLRAQYLSEDTSLGTTSINRVERLRRQK